MREVHLWGGFPCVHLSSVRHGRRNLEGEGSNLFFALVQLIDWARAVWEPLVPVKFIVENVASMDTSARDTISQRLDVVPLRLDPSTVQPMSRPRLAWTSFPVAAQEGVILTQAAGFVEVTMSAPFPEDAAWVDPGWERVDPSSILPTFMKAIARFRQVYIAVTKPLGSAGAPAITNSHLTSFNSNTCWLIKKVTFAQPTLLSGRSSWVWDLGQHSSASVLGLLNSSPAHMKISDFLF